MCDAVNKTLQVKQPTEDSLQVYEILLFVVSTIGVILNGLLLILGKGRLPKSCAMFICNLAAADLGTTLLFMIVAFRRMISSGKFMNIISLMTWVTVLVSFLTLLSIAVQRYIAVVHSLWSHTKIKGQPWFYTILLVTIWLIAIIFGAVMYYEYRVTSLVLTTIFEIIIVAVTALYFKIYMSFRDYRVRNQQGIFANRRNLQLNMKKEAKLSLVVSCVTGILVFAVLPYIIMLQIIGAMDISGNLQALRCNRIFKMCYFYWKVMESLAFSLNPIIYFWRFQLINRRDYFDRLGRVRQVIPFIHRRKIAPELVAGPTRPSATEMTGTL